MGSGMAQASRTGATVSAAEIARFDALAGRWWDPDGPMRPLHRMNPARIGWIDARIRQGFPEPEGLRVLDVGCGAGLAAEALARRGYRVLGIDAAADAVAAAKAHAQDPPWGETPIAPDYRAATAEDLLAEGQRFPVVIALEVIEHVPDPAGFIATLATLTDPGGVLILSTLNRTPQSFLAAKVAAEYVLRWLPTGTHDWRRFLTPAELAALLRRAGCRVTDTAGLGPAPLRGGWRIGRVLGVNYMMAAEA